MTNVVARTLGPDAKTEARNEAQSTVEQGGTTVNRPSTPRQLQYYFDTDLGQPVWYDGSGWVDATGASA